MAPQRLTTGTATATAACALLAVACSNVLDLGRYHVAGGDDGGADGASSGAASGTDAGGGRLAASDAGQSPGDAAASAAVDGRAPGEGAASNDGTISDSDAADGTLGSGPSPPPSGGAGDAGQAADGLASDAGSDANAPCDPSSPFGAPALVPGINSTYTEGALRLSPDELTGYFWSSRPGGPGTVNLYVATRPDRGSAFGAATLLAAVNASGTQFDPTLTADGLTLMFGSDRDGGLGLTDLFVAARPAVAADFLPPTSLSALSTSSHDEEPFLLPDGSAIYFASDRGGTFDLYRAPAAGAGGQFAAPVAIAELNASGATDDHPALSPDDLTIFFASNRAGGAGDLDIWMAQRSSPAAPFGAPVDLPNANGTSKDIPDWISADQCRLYLHSDRDGGSEHVYVAVRP